MPIMAIYRSNRVTRDQYNAFRAALPLGAAPPTALVHCLAKPVDGAHLVVEVWETREAFEAFSRDVVNPALEKHGLPIVPPELIELDELAVTPSVKKYEVDLRRTTEPA